jgi:hypothetical protein
MNEQLKSLKGKLQEEFMPKVEELVENLGLLHEFAWHPMGTTDHPEKPALAVNAYIREYGLTLEDCDSLLQKMRQSVTSALPKGCKVAGAALKEDKDSGAWEIKLVIQEDEDDDAVNQADFIPMDSELGQRFKEVLGKKGVEVVSVYADAGDPGWGDLGQPGYAICGLVHVTAERPWEPQATWTRPDPNTGRHQFWAELAALEKEVASDLEEEFQANTSASGTHMWDQSKGGWKLYWNIVNHGVDRMEKIIDVDMDAEGIVNKVVEAKGTIRSMEALQEGGLVVKGEWHRGQSVTSLTEAIGVPESCASYDSNTGMFTLTVKPLKEDSLGQIEWRNVESKDVTALGHALKEVFSDQSEWVVPYTIQHMNPSKSVIALKGNVVLGFYILGDRQLLAGVEEEEATPTEDLSSYGAKTGVEGVALGIIPIARGNGLGSKFKNYPKTLGVDYVWGIQLKQLNNLEHWLKRRRVVAENTESVITLEDYA